VSRVLAAALVFAGVIGVAAQSQAPRDANPVAAVPIGTASLSGVVVDGEKQPLRRASVAISGDMRLNRRTVTDDAGRFTFVDLPGGRFTITAEKPGYPSMSYGAKRPFRAGSGVLIAEGQKLSGLVLQLAKGAVFTGTVFDDRGQPMPGVPIMAWEVRTSLSGERTLDFPATGGESVTTDDRGVYRIFGLPPGEYTIGTAWFFSSFGNDVRVPTDAEIRAAFQLLTQAAAGGPASAAPPAGAPAPPTYNFTPVFYPSAVDPLAAVVMPIAAGEERDGVDIHMQFRPMSRIDGVVVGPDGPVAQARMGLFRRSRVQALNSTSFWASKPDGTFSTASLPPMNYIVLAEMPAVADKPGLWATADVTITGAEPVNVTLTMQPSMTVTGKFVFDGATLKPPADFTRLRANLFGAEGTAASNSMVSATDASGSFTIANVTPGRYRVNIGLPAAAGTGGPIWNVKSVVADGRDVTDVLIDIAPGGAPSVTVTLWDQVTELSGTLLSASGQPATDYFVVALPADREYWTTLTRRIASARPDATGRYIFRNLPPGEYRIAVTTDLVQRDLQDTTALQRLLEASAPVKIGAGEKKIFDLKTGG
jgi:protocatechuate 3,4-dioxygenase beta subunit